MYKIKTAIYSYTPSKSVEGFAGFPTKAHFLDCAKRSVLGARNSFEKVYLYTTSSGKKELKSILHLFDKVKLLDSNKEASWFYAIQKFDAYLDQKEAFLHLDFDFILQEKLELDSEIICEFSENLREYRDEYVAYYQKQGKNKHIRDFVNTGCNGIYAYCCGVFGGTELEFIHQYAKDCKTLVAEYSAWSDKRTIWNVMMIEQGYLALLLGNRKPFTLYGRVLYTHYIGDKKSRYEIE